MTKWSNGMLMSHAIHFGAGILKFSVKNFQNFTFKKIDISRLKVGINKICVAKLEVGLAEKRRKSTGN